MLIGKLHILYMFAIHVPRYRILLFNLIVAYRMTTDQFRKIEAKCQAWLFERFRMPNTMAKYEDLYE